jgi:ArsR family transcriptional regulator
MNDPSLPLAAHEPAAIRWRQRDTLPPYSDALLTLIAERFRLLGEPLRLKLLAILGEQERTVNELVEMSGANQSNISKHLQTMAQGGLVKRRREGTSIYYAIADDTTYALCDLVCAGVQTRLSQQVQSLGLSAPSDQETRT